MNRIPLNILITAMLALPLGSCGSVGPDINFDPTEWFSGDLFGTKKPLPGERKALFPEGVPGVGRGVPQELVKGNRPPPGAEDPGIAPQEAALQAEEPKPKPTPKAKPKPKTAAKPAPAAPPSTPTAVTVRRSDQPPPQQPQQPQQPGAVQWPDPPSSQSRAPGAVQWPDPPPLR